MLLRFSQREVMAAAGGSGLHPESLLGARKQGAFAFWVGFWGASPTAWAGQWRQLRVPGLGVTATFGSSSRDKGVLVRSRGVN